MRSAGDGFLGVHRRDCCRFKCFFRWEWKRTSFAKSAGDSPQVSSLSIANDYQGNENNKVGEFFELSESISPLVDGRCRSTPLRCVHQLVEVAVHFSKKSVADVEAPRMGTRTDSIPDIASHRDRWNHRCTIIEAAGVHDFRYFTETSVWERAGNNVGGCSPYEVFDRR